MSATAMAGGGAVKGNSRGGSDVARSHGGGKGHESHKLKKAKDEDSLERAGKSDRAGKSHGSDETEDDEDAQESGEGGSVGALGGATAVQGGAPVQDLIASLVGVLTRLIAMLQAEAGVEALAPPVQGGGAAEVAMPATASMLSIAPAPTEAPQVATTSARATTRTRTS